MYGRSACLTFAVTRETGKRMQRRPAAPEGAFGAFGAGFFFSFLALPPNALQSAKVSSPEGEPAHVILSYISRSEHAPPPHCTAHSISSHCTTHNSAPHSLAAILSCPTAARPVCCVCCPGLHSLLAMLQAARLQEASLPSGCRSGRVPVAGIMAVAGLRAAGLQP